MDAEPAVTRVDLDTAPEGGRQILNDVLGLASVGMSLMVFRPGQRWRIHTHRNQEEVYVVLAGELTLLVEEVDGGITELVLEADQAARVGPAVRRQLINRVRVKTRFLAVGAAGDHERQDAIAWHSWDDTGEGFSPRDVPLPTDLPV